MKRYSVTIHFDGPEDCAWFFSRAKKHKEYASKGSQLEGGGRGILMAALGRSIFVESTMSTEEVRRQICGTPVSA